MNNFSQYPVSNQLMKYVVSCCIKKTNTENYEVVQSWVNEYTFIPWKKYNHNHLVYPTNCKISLNRYVLSVLHTVNS